VKLRLTTFLLKNFMMMMMMMMMVQGLASYPVPRIISGAMYDGLPQAPCSVTLATVARPRSYNLTVGFPSAVWSTCIHTTNPRTDPAGPFPPALDYRSNSYKLINIRFITIYENVFFSARIVNIWNNLPNFVVNESTVNAFKARLDKFWSYQAAEFHFTVDLTGIGNRSE